MKVFLGFLRLFGAKQPFKRHRQILGGRFGYFLFFLLGEGGRRSPRCRGGGTGDRFFIENPKEGGVSSTGGAEGPGGCLWQIGEFGGGGAKYFFSGPKCPPRIFLGQIQCFLL